MKFTMRSLVCALLLGVSLLSASGCAHTPPTITTPAGQRAYKADQIDIRVNELQNAAIQAEATGGLPTATARIIIQFTTAANKTLHDTPAGWPQTLQTAWTQTKQAVGVVTNPAVAAAMGAVDAVLAVEVQQ